MNRFMSFLNSEEHERIVMSDFYRNKHELKMVCDEYDFLRAGREQINILFSEQTYKDNYIYAMTDTQKIGESSEDQFAKLSAICSEIIVLSGKYQTNKSASVKLRSLLMDVAKISANLRKVILDVKKAIPVKKRAKKDETAPVSSGSETETMAEPAPVEEVPDAPVPIESAPAEPVEAKKVATSRRKKQ